MTIKELEAACDAAQRKVSEVTQRAQSLKDPELVAAKAEYEAAYNALTRAKHPHGGA